MPLVAEPGSDGFMVGARGFHADGNLHGVVVGEPVAELGKALGSVAEELAFDFEFVVFQKEGGVDFAFCDVKSEAERHGELPVFGFGLSFLVSVFVHGSSCELNLFPMGGFRYRSALREGKRRKGAYLRSRLSLASPPILLSPAIRKNKSISK